MSVHKYVANHIPVCAWPYTNAYLSEKEQAVCILVCKRLAILALCNPSADLEEMGQIKKTIPMNSKLFSNRQKSAIGPTGRFLSKQPNDAILKKIQEEREKEPTIDQTVRNVCAIEAAHPEYIPLYHGGKLESLSYMLFIRALLSIPYVQEIEKFPCPNPLIYYPSLDGPKTIGEALAEFPPDFDDHMFSVRKELLSCNTFLFANFDETGESSWFFYLKNKSVFHYYVQPLLKNLCENYQIRPDPTYLSQLENLYEELCQLAITFTEQVPSRQEKMHNGVICRGALLQILIKPSVLDKVAYASLPYGKIDKMSDQSLSERCLTLREDPDSEPFMQVRLLTQALFIKSYGIKVFIHCCGGFFKEEGLADSKPELITEKGWEIQKNVLLRKEKLLVQVREIFTKMILLSPRKSLRIPSVNRNTNRTISFNYTTLRKKASMSLPSGFRLEPYYDQKLLVKVVQIDPDEIETTYLLIPPRTVQVIPEELASLSSAISTKVLIMDKRLGKIVKILKVDEYERDTIYTCD